MYSDLKKKKKVKVNSTEAIMLYIKEKPLLRF